MKESGWLKGQRTYVSKLHKMPIFQPFSDDVLTDFLSICKIKVYDPQELIVKEGERERSMYFMLTGCVQVIREGRTIAKLESVGEIFGEMGFLDGEVRSASVVAVEETTCLMVDAACLERLGENDESCIGARIYHTVAMILSMRLRETTRLLFVAKKELDQLQDLIGTRSSKKNATRRS